MNYSKPEVSVLGEAVEVIEILNRNATSVDGFAGPAYDLDE
jgi:hypothetical protein